MNPAPSPQPPEPPDRQADLRAAARDAARRAYAPYSHFAVGAAVRDDEGRIHAGCNVENASYGLTVCAERNAIAAAVLAGARRIVALAVFTPTDTLTPPCGACRQVLAEFGGDGLEIHLENQDGTRATMRLGDLLPCGFRLPG